MTNTEVRIALVKRIDYLERVLFDLLSDYELFMEDYKFRSCYEDMCKIRDGVRKALNE